MLLNDAIRGEDFGAARVLGAMAVAEARKTHDAGLVKEAQSHVQDLERLAKGYAEVKAANETLEKDPTDPKANLAVGRHLCFVKGDWEQGVPMLALSGDAGLKAAADKDLAADDSKAQTAAGDAWWDLAEKEQGMVREQMRQRAVTWYRQAHPASTGLAAVKIEKRIHEIEQATAASPAAAVQDRTSHPVRTDLRLRPGFLHDLRQRAAGAPGRRRGRGQGFQLQSGRRRYGDGRRRAGRQRLLLRDSCDQRQRRDRDRAGVERLHAGLRGPVVPAGQVAADLPGARGDASPKQTTEPMFKATGVPAPAIWGRGDTCYLILMTK